MAEHESLVLEHLRALRNEMVDLRSDFRSFAQEVRERVGHLEEQQASLSRRVDNLASGLDRVFKRLELVH